MNRLLAIALLFLTASNYALAVDETTVLPLDGSGIPNSYPVPQGSNHSKAKSDSNSTPIISAVEVGFELPVILGQMSQNFNPSFGMHGSVYFHFFDEFRNGIYFGYQNFPVRADTTSAFRIMPILAQIGVEGKTGLDWLKPTFDLGVGGAFGWLNTLNSASIHVNGYFAFQFQPGLEFQVYDQFVITTHVPILYIVGTKVLPYLAYDAGLKFNF